MCLPGKGITLVALIITIIILLILAGIIINLTVGQRGILNRAQEAGKNYQEAAIKEEEELTNLFGEFSMQTNEDENEYIKFLHQKVFLDGMPLVPQMQSNKSEVGEVITSSVKKDREGYKAFDRIYNFGDIVQYNDIENTWQTESNDKNYIQFNFVRPVYVKRIEFIPSYTSAYGGVAVKYAKLQLSNDGENFIDASHLIEYSNEINTVMQWQKIESNDIKNSYRFVRLYVEGSNTSSYGSGIAIREIQIYGFYEY